MPRTVKKNKELAAGQPPKPTNLSPRAAIEWDRLSGELAASNIRVTPGHRAVMSMAATIAADITEAWEAVQRDGAFIMGKAGLVAHPASKRLDALRRRQRGGDGPKAPGGPRQHGGGVDKGFCRDSVMVYRSLA